MPAQPQWIERIPEIREAIVAAPETPVFDTASVQSLFGVKARRAQQLMQLLASLAAEQGIGPAFRSGRNHLLTRKQALAALEILANRPEVAQTRALAKRLAVTVAERQALQAARVQRISAAPDVRRRRLADLPATVKLSKCRLEIEFWSEEDLFEQLAQIGYARANDAQGFRALVEGEDG